MSERHSRQEAIIGAEGQARLASATVGIVGAGGLGSLAAELLCRAGVGTIIILDYDTVELSNLQRQALYEEADLGKPKALAAAEHLRRIDPAVKAIAHVKQASVATLGLLDDAELILDCTDNLQARLILNEYAMKRKVPFIYCGAVETRGMLYVVDPTRKERACFSCVFEKLKSVENCEDFGVLNTTVHLAATLEVAEALKLLLGEEYTEGIVSFETAELRLDRFTVKRNLGCKVCAGVYDRLSGKAPAVEFCVTRRCVKARPNAGIELDLARIRTAEGIEVVEDHGTGLKASIDGHEVLISSSGNLEFATKDQDAAKRLTERIYKLGKK